MEKKKKEYNVRPKPAHYTVARKLAENGRSYGQAIKEAGYSESAQKKPSKVLKTKGFRMVAEEVGLTDNFILKALKEDIEHKKKKREPELRLASKIKGMLTDKVDITTDGKPLVIPQSLYNKYQGKQTNNT